MRKVDKSLNIPGTLQNAPVPTNVGEVQSNIYGADDVRIQLCTDQHYKCAYCECDLTKSYNDVEHYRPKSKYYWLGHDWDNLLYSCDLCNRSYKNDSFPLINEANRMTALGDLSGEGPLIINPASEDPAYHIRFNRHMMVHQTSKGEKTIEMFHLNDRAKRPELINNREQLYELYKLELSDSERLQKILQSNALTQELIDDFMKLVELSKRRMDNLKSPARAYSGMLITQI